MNKKQYRKTSDMNMSGSRDWTVAPEYKTRVLQNVRDLCNAHHGKVIDWTEAARRVASITGDPTTTGLDLARWLNNGNQRKEFPEWFLSEYRSWARSRARREEPVEPEPVPEVEETEEEPEINEVTDASLMMFRGTKIGMRGDPHQSVLPLEPPVRTSKAG